MSGGASVAAWLLVALVLATTAQAQAPSLEYQVKASHLYNFTQFIEWPAGAFASTPRFNLCVLGAWRFGRALDALEGERVQGREIAILALNDADEARATRCHALFVSASGRSAARAAMPLEHGLLTVGEMPGFLGRGGIINLVDVEGRIRFEINRNAAQQAGLAMSAQLLRLALNAP